MRNASSESPSLVVSRAYIIGRRPFHDARRYGRFATAARRGRFEKRERKKRKKMRISIDSIGRSRRDPAAYITVEGPPVSFSRPKAHVRISFSMPTPSLATLFPPPPSPKSSLFSLCPSSLRAITLCPSRASGAAPDRGYTLGPSGVLRSRRPYPSGCRSPRISGRTRTCVTY